MERFAAMVAARRAPPAPKHAPPPAVEERKEEEEMDEDYLRIQLEEIVIVKDDAYDALAAATAAAHANGDGTRYHSSIHATASVEKCGKATATAAAQGGCSVKATAAAQGAWTKVGRIVWL